MGAALGSCALLALFLVGCGDDAVRVAGGSTAPGGAALWSRTLGRSVSLERVSAAAHPQGGVVVGGRFFATADFGGGPVTAPVNNYQGYVARYDDAGELVWLLSAGDIYDEDVDHIAVDGAGNVYVLGTFRGEITLGAETLQSSWQQATVFLAKLSPAGEVAWARQLGPSSGNVESMLVDGDGSLTLFANYGPSLDLGDGPLGIDGPLLAKLDTNGAVQFARSLQAGGQGYQVTAIALDPSTGGTVRVAAFYSDTYGSRTQIAHTDAAGETVAERDLATEYAPDNLAVGSDGSIYVAGYLQNPVDLGGGVQLSAPTLGAAYVIALAADGAPRWARVFDPLLAETDYNGLAIDSGVLTVNALAVSPEGRVIAGGTFHGVLHFGEPPAEGEVDPDAMVSVPWSGWSEYDTWYGPDDAFAIALEPDGSDRWHRSFGAGHSQSVTALAPVGADQVVVAGSGQGEQAPYFEGFAVAFGR